MPSVGRPNRAVTLNLLGDLPDIPRRISVSLRTQPPSPGRRARPAAEHWLATGTNRPRAFFMRGEPRGIVANAGGKNAHELGSKWHELAPFTHQLRFFVHKKAENPQFPAKSGKAGGSAWIFLPRAFFMGGEALAVRTPPIWVCALTAFIAQIFPLDEGDLGFQPHGKKGKMGASPV